MPMKPIRASEKIRMRARALRKAPTPAEARLWEALRNRKLGGFKFRRQHPIGRAIADFYCAEVRLVVEVDGGVHNVQREYDEARTEMLQSRGYTVIRFTNREVLENLDAVTAKILKACKRLLK